MSVVKINALHVPIGSGPELERRFAGRLAAIESEPGLLRFQLLRPTAGELRYFVLTEWESETDFERWRGGSGKTAHAPERSGPIASHTDLLEFEVVLDSTAGDVRTEN